MVERVPDSDYDQMQHFISKSPWDAQGVMNLVCEKTYQTLKRAEAGSSLGLLLDESGWKKSGKKSVGVARQYIGQLGKVSNGQVGVFASLTNGEQVGLVQGRLYLPREWADDKDRCTKAGIPPNEQVYRTKPELAIEIFKTIPSTIDYDWVGGDSIYGNSYALRAYLYSRKQSFVMDVGEELGVYLTLPQLYMPTKKEGRGRTPAQYVCDDEPIRLKNLIKQIPQDKWQTITHRQGTKGPLVCRATLVDVHVWKPERGQTIESVQLIMSTEEDGSEVKFSLCYQHEGKMRLETALYRQMQRYFIERAFQNVKEHLGLHQYQVRSYLAWNHHIALTMMALHFLLEIQNENKNEMPLLSIPDIKLVFARKLNNKLNSDDGIFETLANRHAKRQADLDKYARVPK